jgi:hypothetical protein
MSSSNISVADFALFAVLWNQRMGLATPTLHLKMARWLEWNYEKDETRLLLMAFRASGKSTIAGLFAAWLLYRNADLRILVLAADSVLARKMVRQVKKIIERHPLTAHMKPDKAEQWAGSRFTVKRMTNLRDPSMMAKGITSNITGSRADIIICDDVEVPNTCDTADKRLALRERLAEIDYVLTPGGTLLYLGTPHTYYSIYADEPRPETGEEQEFLRGFTRLSLPLLDAKGESTWPEIFTPHAVEKIRRSTGPNKFASQMMLRFVNIADGRLNPDDLQVYGDELDYTKEINTLFLGGTKLVGASAWWDPSFNSGKGDRSVFAVVFADGTGNLYLHRLVYLEAGGPENDNATEQCRAVARIAKENFLPSLSVEINGIGRFLPQILRNELVKIKSPAKTVEISSHRPKAIRILEAFDAVLAAKRLFVHESVLKTPFMTEMKEWRPGVNTFDDGLDAVAGAIAQQPVRLPRLFGAGSHTWMRGAQSHKANTEFEV